MAIKREYEAYQILSASNNPWLRTLYDTIGDHAGLVEDSSAPAPHLVFEWMGLTLNDVPRESYSKNYVFIKALLDTFLTSALAFQREKLVNTRIMSDNILISKLGANPPTIKIGDLAAVHPDGHVEDGLPVDRYNPMRALESLQGLPCTHKSQMWNLAATLFSWLQPGIFGMPVDPGPTWPPWWEWDGRTIANLMCLFPDWKGPPTDDELVRAYFELAEGLVERRGPSLAQILPLSREIDKLDTVPELKSLFHLMLVTDPAKRPSAAEVLSSDAYKAFEKITGETRILSCMDGKIQSKGI
ncbi:hypothetical protein TWF696_004987 [Orbilia brochopaga]|uniref:Protein kinase domain-containing protein n=1 Tax=Orbilia brochopaga TaxID=3140254 RepID=A0AAV9V0M4_9PEZI